MTTSCTPALRTVATQLHAMVATDPVAKVTCAQAAWSRRCVSVCMRERLSAGMAYVECAMCDVHTHHNVSSLGQVSQVGWQLLPLRGDDVLGVAAEVCEL